MCGPVDARRRRRRRLPSSCVGRPPYANPARAGGAGADGWLWPVFASFPSVARPRRRLPRLVRCGQPGRLLAPRPGPISQPTRAHTADSLGTDQTNQHTPRPSVRPRPKNTRAPTGRSYPSPAPSRAPAARLQLSLPATAPEPSCGPRRATPARGHVVHVPMPFPGGRSARWPRPERGRGRVAWQGQRR